MSKLIGLKGMSWDEYQEYYDKNKDKLEEFKVWKVKEVIDSKESNDILGILLKTKLSREELKNKGFDARTIGSGVEIEGWDSELIEYVYEKTKNEYQIYDKIASVNMLLIVSEKFKRLMEESEIKDVQYLPLTNIHDNEGNYLDGYYYMNVLRVLDVETNSLKTAIYNDEDYLDIQVPSYRIDKIKKEDIFYVKVNEYYNSELMFSEKVRKLIKDNDITGFDFERIRVSVD